MCSCHQVFVSFALTIYLFQIISLHEKLITTNVLSRGVDVDNVCLVVNYDVPMDRDGNPDFDTYLHRIGRTGRFGRKGTAISLISDQRSIEVLAAIEAHFSKDGKEMISQAKADPEALADVIEI